MALVVEALVREFVVNINKVETVLTDPNPALSAHDVKDIYMVTYPELLNAQIENKGIQKDNKLRYEFKTVAGTKG